jgi:hypothetical protein
MWRRHAIRGARFKLQPSSSRFSTGKAAHRWKYSGSGKRKREMEARRVRRERGGGAASDHALVRADKQGGSSGRWLGWKPIVFLGVAPLAAWLATVYVKPDLRKELMRSIQSGPKNEQDTSSTST